MNFILDHVHIFTLDPDATAEWFAAHLGGEVLRYKQSDGRPRIDVRFGEVFLYVSRPPAGLGSEADGRQQATGINHIGFSVDDVDRAVERLRRAGVTIIQESRTGRPGVRNAYVRGPEDIQIEIFRRESIDYGQA